MKIELVFISITLSFLYSPIKCSKYFISGKDCGRENEMITMDELPNDVNELLKLECVITSDLKGFQKWKKAVAHPGC